MASEESVFSRAIGPEIVKRQYYGLDPNALPYPNYGFGYYGGGYYWYNKPWGIAALSITGFFVLIFIVWLGYYCIKGRRAGKRGASKAAHQRSLSGISSNDPDNIKPVKRLRSFHMKGSKSADSGSPKTPSGPAGLFNRLFRKKGAHARLPTLDEEAMHSSESLANLNRSIDTPGLDEKMLEASPPPTPDPAFGWSSKSSSTANKRRSVSETLREQNTSYGAEPRPSLSQSESDSFLAERSGRDPRRISQSYDENFQTKPAGGYFDDDDDRNPPPGYNPDSRSAR